MKPINLDAIVVAAFGTSHPDALQPIFGIKKLVEDAFPHIPVEVAFSSRMIVKIWRQRARDIEWCRLHPDIPGFMYEIKSPFATLVNLQEEGHRHFAVQSTHIFAGEEFTNLKAQVDGLLAISTLRERDKPFHSIVLGRPALGEPGIRFPYHADIQKAVRAVSADVELARSANSALVYMGHGNEVFPAGYYTEFEYELRRAHPDIPIYLGNVEGYPSFECVAAALIREQVQEVVLVPFMLVAGDHVKNDMASSDEDSWKSRFETHGIRVNLVMRGLGELEKWRALYLRHLRDVIDVL